MPFYLLDVTISSAEISQITGLPKVTCGIVGTCANCLSCCVSRARVPGSEDNAQPASCTETIAMTRRRLGYTVFVGTLLLGGCVETPMGPTLATLPGPHTSFSGFQDDQAVCRNFAEEAVRDQAQGANVRALGGAALTTALGAGLGAAIGGGRGAGSGLPLARSAARGWQPAAPRTPMRPSKRSTIAPSPLACKSR